MRTAAGWRAYGPAEMELAGEIVQLRSLGLSLAEVARVLARDAEVIDLALTAHHAALASRMRQLADAMARVRRLQADLRQGKVLPAGKLGPPPHPACSPCIVFDLPWPWGGETFELRDIRSLNHIVGPLGSGKTRLARGSPRSCRAQCSWAWID